MNLMYHKIGNNHISILIFVKQHIIHKIVSELSRFHSLKLLNKKYIFFRRK